MHVRKKKLLGIAESIFRYKIGPNVILKHSYKLGGLRIGGLPCDFKDREVLNHQQLVGGGIVNKELSSDLTCKLHLTVFSGFIAMVDWKGYTKEGEKISTVETWIVKNIHKEI